MKLTYDSTTADVVESATRRFLRGKRYATNRWRGSILCAAAFAALAFLGFHAKENVNIVVICLAAAAWGAGLFLISYKGVVRRRITGYVAAELKGPWPRATVCELKDGRFILTTSGANSSFLLADLSGVAEDSAFLELAFGANGLCVIPLRAFASTDEKAAFLATLPRPP